MLQDRDLTHFRYTDFASFPFRRMTEPQFYTKCIHAWVSPLTFIIGFSSGLIRMCSMHTVHLGVCQWLNASAILDLCDIGFFKGNTLAEQLVSLTHAFNRWCRVNSIEPLVFAFIYVRSCLMLLNWDNVFLGDWEGNAMVWPKQGTINIAFLCPYWASIRGTIPS